MRKMLFVVVALCLSVIITAESGKLVALEKSKIRDKASIEGKTIKPVAKGDTLYFSEKQGSWYRVTDKEGKELGWISRKSAAAVLEKVVQDTVVKTDTLVKKDTLIKTDTLVKKDTIRAAALVDSAKSLVDSALAMASRNKPMDFNDCIEMDPANPIVGRKFDQVNMILGRDIGKLMSRYLELNRKNKDLKGKLLIDFIIDRAGKVTDVKFKANTLNNKELEDRAMAVVSAAVFPPAGALDVTSVIVHYPIYFFPW